MLNRKEHLTEEGLRKIASIKAAINLGLSEKVTAAFPNIIPVSRPQVEDQSIKDPHWVVGFAFFFVVSWIYPRNLSIYA
jgi:hypothetical protein